MSHTTNLSLVSESILLLIFLSKASLYGCKKASKAIHDKNSFLRLVTSRDLGSQIHVYIWHSKKDIAKSIAATTELTRCTDNQVAHIRVLGDTYWTECTRNPGTYKTYTYQICVHAPASVRSVRARVNSCACVTRCADACACARLCAHVGEYSYVYVRFHTCG